MQRPLRIALCQINTVPGDVPGNAQRISEVGRTAGALGADLAVFPEMALVGYSPRDLLFRRPFLKAADDALRGLAASVDIPLLVGTVRQREETVGRPLANCAVLLRQGQIDVVVDKALLPVYDVFDEARYFEPGSGSKPIEFEGTAIGVTICEDIWVGEGRHDAQGYAGDPAQELVSAGAEVVLNLSASPYHVGKPGQREELVQQTARRIERPVLLCNLWGGNDEILFDGSSCVASADGILTHRSARFADDLVLVDVPPHSSPAPAFGLDDMEELRSALVCGIRDYAEKCGFSEAVIGLSGGVDSAVTACLVADALGGKNVTGVALPSPFSSAGSIRDARAVAEQNGTGFHAVPIDSGYEELLARARDVVGEGPFGVMEENLQARVRGALLMAVSNRTGALLVTTGNKSELAVGYCTLYGDMCGGLAAISDVYKTDVYRLAEIYATQGRLPRETIEKPPSAELRPDQQDQDSLPPYDVLDAVLKLHVDENRSPQGIRSKLPHVPGELVNRILEMVGRSEYKRWQAAPGLRVSTKAFGVGRRVPIVANPLFYLDTPAAEPGADPKR